MTDSQRRWLPLYIPLLIITVLWAAFAYQEHNYAREDRAMAIKQRDRTGLIEDRIRDAVVNGSVRPLIIYYVGDNSWGDEKVIVWPKSAEELLGWTRKDIEEKGLQTIVPEDDRAAHSAGMLKAMESPICDTKTLVLHKLAIHKDGSLVPVRITAWRLGDGTRALAAYIDAEDRVREQGSAEGAAAEGEGFNSLPERYRSDPTCGSLVDVEEIVEGGLSSGPFTVIEFK